MTFSKHISMLAACAAVALAAACSPGHDGAKVAGQLPPPPLGVAVPVSLPIAGARGLQDDVFFSDELQKARQRLEVMRAEMASLSTRLSLLQDKIKTVSAEIETAPAVVTTTTPTPTGETTTTTSVQVVPATATLAEIAAKDAKDMVAVPVGEGPIAVSPTMMTTPSVASAVTTTTTTTAAPTTDAPTQITGEMATPVVEPVKPAVAKAEAKAEAKAPAATKEAGVHNVRIGTHDKVVRVVLDVNGSAEGAKSEINNTDHVMTVTLPKTKWATGATQKIANNPVVASYSGLANGEGSVVAFILKGDAKIVSTSTLSNPTRVVIDIAK